MEEKSIGEKIAHGTIIIIAVSVLAKLTAFIAEAINANYLGTTDQSDAYYMVSSIQQVIYPMLSIGVWKVFLPIYKDRITQGDRSGADRITNQMITFFTLVSLTAVAALMIFSPAVVSLVAPGFTGATRELCIRLVRISAPMYVFIIAAAIYASVLQCHGKFLGSQIREVVSHIPSILAVMLLYRRFGMTVLAYALIAGGLIRLLSELPFVDWGYHYRPDFHFRGKEFRLMLTRLPSALLSAGVQQINALVDKAMASTFPAGAVSGLNYGARLTHVFSGLLSTAISTAMYPQMIELISLKKKRELSRLVEKILVIFGVLMIPVSLACILFRTELVRVVFQRGAFDEHSTALTAGIFALYAISLYFVACSSVVSNLFYGSGDTKTPLIINIAHTLMNVVLNLTLSHLMGVNGLALATSLSAILTLLIRMYFSRRYVDWERERILLPLGKTLGISLVSCGGAYIAARLLFAGSLARLICGAAIGVPVYLLLARTVKLEELDDVIKLLRKRIRR